jgi:DNA-binding MarR family transcriptional regulator
MDQPVGMLLRRVYVLITSAEGGDASAARDVAVLDVLAGQGASSQQDLAERLGINRTIMVRVLDRLADAGWVERVRNPADRRSYELRLTPAGDAARTDLRREAAERSAGLTTVLTPGERERLDALLAGLLPEPAEHGPELGTEFLVAQAHLAMRRFADGLLAGTGLRVSYFGALIAIEQLGAGTQRDIARQLEITEPATAEIVDELVTAGYVTRDRDPEDRRRYALRLTDEGRAALVTLRAATHEVHTSVASRLGEEATGELRTLLKRLLDGRAEPWSAP